MTNLQMIKLRVYLKSPVELDGTFSYASVKKLPRRFEV